MTDAIAHGATFADAIAGLGFEPPRRIRPGQWTRFSTNGKSKDDAGSCYLFEDGRGGLIWDWRTNQRWMWRADSRQDRLFTAEDRARRDRELAAAERKRLQQEAKKHANAAERAAMILRAATPARPDHGYLQRKQVGAGGLFEIDAPELQRLLGYAPQAKGQPLTGRILVAPIVYGDALASLEFIDEIGLKAALFGGRKSGAWWTPGLPDGDGTGCVIYIGEGIATVKTVADLTGCNVAAALTCGNLKAVVLAFREHFPGARLVVVSDVGNGQSKAEEAARAAGADLVVPVMPAGCDGTDINDLAGFDKEEARRQLLREPAQPAPKPPPSPISPQPDPDAPSVGACREMLAAAMNQFGREAITFWNRKAECDAAEASDEDYVADLMAPPTPKTPQLGIVGPTGLGKTVTLWPLIRRLREALPDRPLAIFVPTLHLADEAATKAIAAGLRACVIRGRDATGPDGDKMCLNGTAVEDAMSACETVQNTVCAKTVGGERKLCEHFENCAYQNQKKDAAEADVIFMPHQYLFLQKPEFITAVSAVVIDEAFWQVGIAGKPRKLVCDELRTAVFSVMRKGRRDDGATADLHAANRRLGAAIAACDGPLTAAACVEAGITESLAAEAARLWWRCKKPSGMYPGMPPAKRKELLLAVQEINQAVVRYSAAWKVVRDMLNSGVDCTSFITCGQLKIDGALVRGSLLKARRDIASGWDAPTLVLDATLRPELVTSYLPHLDVVAIPYPKTPHARIVQVLGAPVTKHKLSAAEHRREKDKITARNHRIDLARYIEIKAAEHRTLLVVCQMEIEEALKEIGLPANVDITHFNATRGIDKWNHVDFLLSIGRTLPGPEVVEGLAAALAGKPVTPAPESALGRWYMDDGRHPDPVAEAVRWSIAEAEICQTIGRARAVNRGPGNPVLIEAMIDLPLPLPVDDTKSWTVPTRLAVMAARGWWIETPTDRARCFPDLWGTPDEARMDAGRTRTNAFIKDTLKAFVRLLYQPPGSGQKPRSALFDPNKITAPRQWLESRLGPLARFEVQQPEAAPEPAEPEAPEPAPAAEPASFQRIETEAGPCWISADGRRWLHEPTEADIAQPGRQTIVTDDLPPPVAPPAACDPARVLGPWFPADPLPTCGISIAGIPVETLAQRAGAKVVELLSATLCSQAWHRVGYGGCWDDYENFAAACRAA